jgi:hypothetical protein
MDLLNSFCNARSISEITGYVVILEFRKSLMENASSHHLITITKQKANSNPIHASQPVITMFLLIKTFLFKTVFIHHEKYAWQCGIYYL